MTNTERIELLREKCGLSKDDWMQLISSYSPEDAEYARSLAQSIAIDRFGKNVYFRGIIEFSNICKNDCFYCGIRRSNGCVSRYRLSEEEILECCHEGYEFGYRTFVLQSGEDGYWNDERMTALVSRIHKEFPDCAVTLSIGERSRESYQKLFDAGAGRYLLRHETANKEHYEKLHPQGMSFEHRMECLNELKSIGYQTGCGMMVGAPYQTAKELAEDMMFLSSFKPQMVGMGPFISHKDTPFKDKPSGSVELTLFLLSLVRIMLPKVLLPSTTALGTVQGNGRQLGILAGCNVVMPNLSPASVRKKYLLYDNKVGTENDAESGIRILKKQMEEIGYNVVVTKGDYEGR